MQLPPSGLIAGVMDSKTVRIVNCGPVVVYVLAVVGVEQEHTCQWSYTGLRNVGPRKEYRLEVEGGLLSGTNGKAIGAGGARALKQRMHDNGCCIWLWPFDP